MEETMSESLKKRRAALKWMRDYNRRTTLDCGHHRGNLPPVKVGKFTVCGEGCARFIYQQHAKEDAHLQIVAKKPR